MWADEVKRKQVVLNLLANAVEFAHDGGSVDVSASASGGEARMVAAADEPLDAVAGDERADEGIEHGSVVTRGRAGANRPPA